MVDGSRAEKDTPAPMDRPDLSAAVAALAALKAEHRQLLLRIAADRGMEPATRIALLEHVLDEEDRKVAGISAMVNGSAGAGPRRGSPTVGSLRPAEPAGRVLGSLRGADSRGRGDRTR